MKGKVKNIAWGLAAYLVAIGIMYKNRVIPKTATGPKAVGAAAANQPVGSTFSRAGGMPVGTLSRSGNPNVGGSRF